MKLYPTDDALRAALLASTPGDLGFAAAGHLEGSKCCIRQADTAYGRPLCALASLVQTATPRRVCRSPRGPVLPWLVPPSEPICPPHATLDLACSQQQQQLLQSPQLQLPQLAPAVPALAQDAAAHGCASMTSGWLHAYLSSCGLGLVYSSSAGRQLEPCSPDGAWEGEGSKGDAGARPRTQLPATAPAAAALCPPACLPGVRSTAPALRPRPAGRAGATPFHESTA